MGVEVPLWFRPDGLRLGEPWSVYLAGECSTVTVWYPYPFQVTALGVSPFDEALAQWRVQTAEYKISIPIALDDLADTIEKHLRAQAQEELDFPFQVSRDVGNYRAYRLPVDEERTCLRSFDVSVFPPSPFGRCGSVCYSMRFDDLVQSQARS